MINTNTVTLLDQALEAENNQLSIKSKSALTEISRALSLGAEVFCPLPLLPSRGLVSQLNFTKPDAREHTSTGDKDE